MCLRGVKNESMSQNPMMFVRTRQVLKQVTAPTERWGPARNKDRTGRYAMPKNDTSKVDTEFPPYWDAVKQWSVLNSGHLESGPPSYQNGRAVKTVADEIPMKVYDASSAAASASGAEAMFTYDVMEPMQNDAADVVGKSSPQESKKSSSTTKAEVHDEYARVSRVSRASNGVVNDAFQHDNDDKGSQVSRDSSVDGVPVPQSPIADNESTTAF